MNAERFLSRVAARGGFSSAAEAELAAGVVLGVLFCELPKADRHLLADALPPVFDKWLPAKCGEVIGAERLIALVSAREGIHSGFAREHTTVVLEALGHELENEVRDRLAEVLPEDLRYYLLTPQTRSQRVTRPLHPGRDRTLSGARPGSQHPVSEAGPVGAHHHSVAAEENPHGESKLSSGHDSSAESGLAGARR